ncbi:hypothetical protein NKR19_g6914, partial [Coniochaeta hoffmannii]
MRGLLKAVLVLAPASALARVGNSGRHVRTSVADDVSLHDVPEMPWDAVIPDAPVTPTSPDMPDAPEIPGEPIEDEALDPLGFEIAELDLLYQQMADLEDMIAFQEQRLAEEYGWLSAGGESECRGLKCLVDKIVEKVSNAALSLYEDVVGVEDMIDGPDGGPGKGPALTAAGRTTATTRITGTTLTATTLVLTRHHGAALLTGSRTTRLRSADAHHHHITAGRITRRPRRPRRLHQAILLTMAVRSTRLLHHHITTGHITRRRLLLLLLHHHLATGLITVVRTTRLLHHPRQATLRLTDPLTTDRETATTAHPQKTRPTCRPLTTPKTTTCPH